MKRILLVFSAVVIAAVALCLWYLPGTMYVPVRHDPTAPALTTAPPSAVTLPPPEATEPPTEPPDTAAPTPVETPAPTEAQPGETESGGPSATSDQTPEPAPEATPESGSEVVDIEGQSTPAPADQTNNASAQSTRAPVMTPIPATPRTAPPQAPLAYEPSIDESQKSNGVIEVRYYSESNPKLKVQIKQSSTYNYDMKADNSPFRYPLNMGDGRYEIAILENVSGSSYRNVTVETLDVQLASATAPYLQSIQIVDWDPAMAPILEALAFRASAGDAGVTDAIYTRLVNYLSYDFDKYNKKLPSGYLPDITDTYATGKGICYDMSALMAGMLRSVGVPTRLMMGNTKWVNGYHAWNEVYVNGDWVIVDLTVDTQLRDYGDAYTFAKNKSEYSASKRY